MRQPLQRAFASLARTPVKQLQQPRPRMHLIFDFDGTITRRDTIGELARSAIARQQSHGGGGGGGLEAAWEQAVRDYGADYSAYRQEYRPAEAQRRSATDEVRYLAGLKSVEEASLDRVGRSGVFAGLGADQLFCMGVEAVEARRVAVRDGFADLVELAARRGWRVDVVSVNWSGAFIRGVIHPHRLAVTANEISPDGHIRGPGGPLGADRITTSPDKLRAVHHLIEAAAADDNNSNTNRVLYFGDSATDMECLLHEDGVVVADGRDSALMQVLGRIGVEVPHIGELPPHSRNDGVVLSWASDFREVLDSGILE
ncbi:haloacid dehalogenase-like hydrolase [Hirsutella rhossiliensis]|uniref:Haloacid dehalogenase-like hydrolase domain-containing protein n=1 Tax=Hirsutella rhossiliensis TaxID=111463 RepID=A0A9P8SLV9_9HYPO|nr:haloacid dehalogenase-like hydrolase domain-containing protein [Hirsutella rhossiliensis]KAH0967351.1 haloacid dehalogenase-like hydrolase domain-containing protein [Hirsutella rhossiliensis]